MPVWIPSLALGHDEHGSIRAEISVLRILRKSSISKGRSDMKDQFRPSDLVVLGDPKQTGQVQRYQWPVTGGDPFEGYEAEDGNVILHSDHEREMRAAIEVIELLRQDAEHYINLVGDQPSNDYSLGRYDTWKWVEEKAREFLKGRT
jgi:hypothetical protein